jgi:hypothetical protein
VSHVVRVLGSDGSRVEEIRLLLQVVTEGMAEKIQLACSAPAPPGAALQASHGPCPYHHH